MILFPAIDLKQGACVRLKLGDMDQATHYNDDPANQAKIFQDQGFTHLHVVDLDGAFSGKSENATAVKTILETVSMPVQLGGGIRTLENIQHWLELGVSRVILGTIAVRDPELVRKAAKLFPGKIIVGIDARAGHVAVEGWAETSAMKTIDLAQKFEDAGVSAIIHTDIDRDGILKGLNMKETLALAHAVSIPVIASGGLASMDDIHALCAPEAQILEGAITGKALYDGRIDPQKALKTLKQHSKEKV